MKEFLKKTKRFWAILFTVILIIELVSSHVGPNRVFATENSVQEKISGESAPDLTPTDPPTSESTPVEVTDTPTPEPISPPVEVTDTPTPEPISPPAEVTDTPTPEPISPPAEVTDTPTPEPTPVEVTDTPTPTPVEVTNTPTPEPTTPSKVTDVPAPTTAPTTAPEVTDTPTSTPTNTPTPTITPTPAPRAVFNSYGVYSTQTKPGKGAKSLTKLTLNQSYYLWADIAVHNSDEVPVCTWVVQRQGDSKGMKISNPADQPTELTLSRIGTYEVTCSYTLNGKKYQPSLTPIVLKVADSFTISLDRESAQYRFGETVTLTANGVTASSYTIQWLIKDQNSRTLYENNKGSLEAKYKVEESGLTCYATAKLIYNDKTLGLDPVDAGTKIFSTKPLELGAIYEKENIGTFYQTDGDKKITLNTSYRTAEGELIDYSDYVSYTASVRRPGSETWNDLTVEGDFSVTIPVAEPGQYAYKFELASCADANAIKHERATIAEGTYIVKEVLNVAQNLEETISKRSDGSDEVTSDLSSAFKLVHGSGKDFEGSTVTLKIDASKLQYKQTRPGIGIAITNHGAFSLEGTDSAYYDVSQTGTFFGDILPNELSEEVRLIDWSKDVTPTQILDSVLVNANFGERTGISNSWFTDKNLITVKDEEENDWEVLPLLSVPENVSLITFEEDEDENPYGIEKEFQGVEKETLHIGTDNKAEEIYAKVTTDEVNVEGNTVQKVVYYGPFSVKFKYDDLTPSGKLSVKEVRNKANSGETLAGRLSENIRMIVETVEELTDDELDGKTIVLHKDSSLEISIDLKDQETGSGISTNDDGSYGILVSNKELTKEEWEGSQDYRKTVTIPASDTPQSLYVYEKLADNAGNEMFIPLTWTMLNDKEAPVLALETSFTIDENHEGADLVVSAEDYQTSVRRIDAYLYDGDGEDITEYTYWKGEEKESEKGLLNPDVIEQMSAEDLTVRIGKELYGSFLRLLIRLEDWAGNVSYYVYSGMNEDGKAQFTKVENDKAEAAEKEDATEAAKGRETAALAGATFAIYNNPTVKISHTRIAESAKTLVTRKTGEGYDYIFTDIASISLELTNIPIGTLVANFTLDENSQGLGEASYNVEKHEYQYANTSFLTNADGDYTFTLTAPALEGKSSEEEGNYIAIEQDENVDVWSAKVDTEAKAKIVEEAFVSDTTRPVVSVEFSDATGEVSDEVDGNEIVYTYYYGLANGTGEPTAATVTFTVEEKNWYEKDIPDICVTRNGVELEELPSYIVKENAWQDKGEGKHTLALTINPPTTAEADAEYGFALVNEKESGNYYNYISCTEEDADNKNDKNRLEGTNTKSDKTVIVDTIRPQVKYSVTKNQEEEPGEDKAAGYYKDGFSEILVVEEANPDLRDKQTVHGLTRSEIGSSEVTEQLVEPEEDAAKGTLTYTWIRDVDGIYSLEYTALDLAGNKPEFVAGEGVLKGDEEAILDANESDLHQLRTKDKVLRTNGPEVVYTAPEIDAEHVYKGEADYFNSDFIVTFAVEKGFFEIGDIKLTANPSTATITAIEEDGTFVYTASVEAKEDHSNDGKYEFTISGKDKAGNLIKVTKEKDSNDPEQSRAGTYTTGLKVMDTKAPVYTLTKMTAPQDPVENVEGSRTYYGSGLDGSDLNVVFEVEDDNLDINKFATGYSYDVAEESGGYAATSPKWNKPTNGGTFVPESLTNAEFGVSVVIGQKDGAYRFEIAGEDKAGNVLAMSETEEERNEKAKADKEQYRMTEACEEGEGQFWTMVKVIDTVSPEGNIEIGDYYTADITKRGLAVTSARPYRSETTASGSITTVKDDSPVRISYKVNSSVKELRQEQKDSEYKWNQSVKFSATEGQQVFYLTVELKDRAGNTTGEVETSRIYLDKTAPKGDNLDPIITIKVNNMSNGHGPEGIDIFNDTVEFLITVSDPYAPKEVEEGEASNSRSSGLNKIWYTISDNKTGKKVEDILLNESVGYSISDDGVLSQDLLTYIYSNQENEQVVKADEVMFNSNDLEITVHATDHAGNESSRSYLFGIDTSAPTITVKFEDDENAKNGKYFNKNRKAIIEVTERNFDASKIQFNITKNADSYIFGDLQGWGFKEHGEKEDGYENGDNDVWIKEIPFSAEGDYVFKISGEDALGNKASSIKFEGVAADKFTIDKTAPELIYSMTEPSNVDDDGKDYYNDDFVLSFSVKDINFWQNGVTFKVNDVVVEDALLPKQSSEDKDTYIYSYRVEKDAKNHRTDGVYVFEIEGKDLAGNPIELISKPTWANKHKQDPSSSTPGKYRTCEKVMDTICPKVIYDAGKNRYHYENEADYYKEGYQKDNHKEGLIVKFSVYETNFKELKLSSNNVKAICSDKAVLTEKTKIPMYMGFVEDDENNQGEYTFTLKGTDKAGNPINVSKSDDGGTSENDPSEAQNGEYTTGVKILDKTNPQVTYTITKLQNKKYSYEKEADYYKDPFDVTFAVEEKYFDRNRMELISMATAEVVIPETDGGTLYKRSVTKEGIYQFKFLGTDKAGNPFTIKEMKEGDGRTQNDDEKEKIETDENGKERVAYTTGKKVLDLTDPVATYSISKISDTHIYKDEADYYNKNFKVTFYVDDVNLATSHNGEVITSLKVLSQDGKHVMGQVEGDPNTQEGKNKHPEIIKGRYKYTFEVDSSYPDGGYYFKMKGEDKSGRPLSFRLGQFTSSNDPESSAQNPITGSYKTGMKVKDTLSPELTFEGTYLESEHVYHLDGGDQDMTNGDYYNGTFSETFKVKELNYDSEKMLFTVEEYDSVHGRWIESPRIEARNKEKSFKATVTEQRENHSHDGRYRFKLSGVDKAGNKLKVGGKEGLINKTDNDPKETVTERIKEKSSGAFEPYGTYMTGEKVMDTIAPKYTYSETRNVIDESQNVDGNRAYYGINFFKAGNLRAQFDVTDTNLDSEKVKTMTIKDNVEGDYSTMNPKWVNPFTNRKSAKGTKRINEKSYGPLSLNVTDPDGVYRFEIAGEDMAGNQLSMSDKEEDDSIKKKRTEYKRTEANDKANGQFWSMPKVKDTVAPTGEVDVSSTNVATAYYKAGLKATGVLSVTDAAPYRQETSAFVAIKTTLDYSPVKIECLRNSSVGASSREVTDYLYKQTKSFSQEGQQVFELGITLTDRAGNTTDEVKTNRIYLDVERPVVDELAPIVKISATANNSNHGPAGNPLFNSEVTFHISISDPYAPSDGDFQNSRSSGLDQVEYSISVDGQEKDRISLRKDRKLADSQRRVDPYHFDSNDLVYQQKNPELFYGINENVTVPSSSYNYNNLVLTVYATDHSGNEREEEYEFGIDVTNPTIQVTYDNNDVRNDRYFKADRTATVVVTERNFDESKINITTNGGSQSGWSYANHGGNGDNDTWTKTITYAEDGDFTFDITGADLLGNPANSISIEGAAAKDFTVDKTAPVIDISFDRSDGTGYNSSNYFNTDRSADVHIVEHNFRSSDAEVTYPDLKTTGRTNGTASAGVWNDRGDDHNYAISFTEDGDYKVTANYTDLAGNEAEEQISQEFTIDKTKPTLYFVENTVEDKKAYGLDDRFLPEIFYEDTNLEPAQVEFKMSSRRKRSAGEPFQQLNDAFSGTSKFPELDVVKENDDIYDIVAVVTDKAGNPTPIKCTVSINRFGSNWDYGDDATRNLVTVKRYTNQETDVTLQEINVTETEIDTVGLTREGMVYKALKEGVDYKREKQTDSNGWSAYLYTFFAENFKEEGRYEITVLTKDEGNNLNDNMAQNENNNTTKDVPLTFVIDKTPPSAVIENMDSTQPNIQVNQDSLEVKLRLEDNYLRSISRVLIEILRSNGETIKQEDYYDYDPETGEYVHKLQDHLEVNRGDDKVVPFVIESDNAPQTVRVTVWDTAGNVSQTVHTESGESEEGQVVLENILVTTNQFSRIFYNRPLFIGIVAGVAVVAGLLIFIFVKKRKKKDAQ